jgi:hypothetical protein
MSRFLLLAGMLAMATPSMAQAQETGLADIHEWRREGSRTCMAEHFHDGSGNGATRKNAEASAIASWASFTIFEYGGRWGNYALAASKRMNCSQNGAAHWSCELTARPCRR